MAASILNSERAVSMSVFVVRAFVKMIEHILANAAVLKRLAEIDKTCGTITPASGGGDGCTREDYGSGLPG